MTKLILKFNFEDYLSVDIEIIRECMKLILIPKDNFQEIPFDIFNDRAILKYNEEWKA
jgi:hypothetical protein